MKASELKIGNYVRHQLFDKNITITSDHIQQLESGMDQDILQGIPITEEWLVNFGFEENYRSKLRVNYDAPNETMGYDFNKNEKKMEGFRFYGRWIEGINYVHKLQNLYFALTGEELTLKK